MKEFKFKTSKGKFIIKEYSTFNDLIKDANFYKQKICKLSEITEEQASEIIDKVMSNQHFQNYNFKGFADRWVKSAIESLHSLFKANGIYLYEKPCLPDEYIASKEALLYDKEEESKIFYNPYIFKIDQA